MIDASRDLVYHFSLSHFSIFQSLVSLLSLSTKDIESRTETLGLLQTLKADPEAFYTHMTKYVYRSIAGTDQLRLLFYFTLLENCGCADCFPASAMKPDTHLKLLKKLKAVAGGEWQRWPNFGGGVGLNSCKIIWRNRGFNRWRTVAQMKR